MKKSIISELNRNRNKHVAPPRVKNNPKYPQPTQVSWTWKTTFNFCTPVVSIPFQQLLW